MAVYVGQRRRAGRGRSGGYSVGRGEGVRGKGSVGGEVEDDGCEGGVGDNETIRIRG